MNHPRSLLLIAALAWLTQNSASADIVFTANLTHNQESTQGVLVTSTGAPRPLSFGSATFVLNDAQTALTMTATIFNIDVTGTQTADTNDNLLAAHIHVGQPPGMDAPEGNAGTTLATNLPQILAGLSYVNFHTAQFPAGEIRGQILRTPDAGSSVLLLGFAVAGILLAARRR
jgi:hypothetical protein